jgi:hypothetical protein
MFQEVVKPANFSRVNLERTITKTGVRGVSSSCPGSEEFSQDFVKYRELGAVFFNSWSKSLSDSTPDTLYPESADDKRDASEASVKYLELKKDGVRHGFDVTGMLVGVSVVAYSRWKPPTERSVKELVDMQKNPLTIKHLLLALAGKPIEKTKKIEEALWLFDGAYAGIAELGYDGVNVIKREDDEVGYFSPNLIKVIQQFGHEAITQGTDPNESCPAKRFIPILWTSMIDYCAQDSRFFETDLMDSE